LLLYIIGYFRDYLFVGINYRIASLTYNEFPDNLPPIPDFFLRFSIEHLYVIKWILTILFTLLYYSVSCFTVYYLFRERKFVIYTTFLFGAVFIISFLIIVTGYVINNHDDTYTLSRHLMGFAQSPVLLMILIPAFGISKNV
jgi:hypothetical protein